MQQLLTCPKCGETRECHPNKVKDYEKRNFIVICNPCFEENRLTTREYIIEDHENKTEEVEEKDSFWSFKLELNYRYSSHFLKRAKQRFGITNKVHEFVKNKIKSMHHYKKQELTGFLSIGKKVQWLIYSDGIVFVYDIIRRKFVTLYSNTQEIEQNSEAKDLLREYNDLKQDVISRITQNDINLIDVFQLKELSVKLLKLKTDKKVGKRIIKMFL